MNNIDSNQLQAIDEESLETVTGGNYLAGGIVIGMAIGAYSYRNEIREFMQSVMDSLTTKTQ